jgi:hypothetical protein
MAGNDETALSAQVVIDPSSASRPEAILDAFARAGFDVGPLWAGNFSITGSRDLFEAFFGQPLPGDVAGMELPLGALPDAMKGKVRSVIFARPIDFGPNGNF